MKKYLLIIFALLNSSFVAWGQVPLPDAALTLQVVEESGDPIAGARASIRAQDKNKDLQRIGDTDATGAFSAQLPSFGYLYYSVGAERRYSAWGEYQFDAGAMGKDPAKWAESKWSPWNPTVRVVLKSKGEAIPMFAKRIMIAPPVLDGTPVGFDFVAGDWTAPHGQGKSKDIIFSATGSIEESNLNLTWSFPNKGDGIRVYPYEGGARSELRSPTQAPNEGYVPTITVDAEGRTKEQIGESRPMSFVFRVQTVLDDAGKVVSAHYGKIYPEAYNVVYYFNPTANSRALEYDPKRNLFKDVKSYERINEP